MAKENSFFLLPRRANQGEEEIGEGMRPDAPLEGKSPSLWRLLRRTPKFSEAARRGGGFLLRFSSAIV